MIESSGRRALYAVSSSQENLISIIARNCTFSNNSYALFDLVRTELFCKGCTFTNEAILADPKPAGLVEPYLTKFT